MQGFLDWLVKWARLRKFHNQQAAASVAVLHVFASDFCSRYSILEMAEKGSHTWRFYKFEVEIIQAIIDNGLIHISPKELYGEVEKVLLAEGYFLLEIKEFRRSF